MNKHLKKYIGLPIIVVVILAIRFSGCEPDVEVRFQSRWHTSPDRRWVGPNFWANRLQDWAVINRRLVCLESRPMRTVHLLTRRLGDTEGDFEISAQFGRVRQASEDTSLSSAGILLGAGADLDYRAAALIHHSHGPSGGLYAGIDTRGFLFLSDFEEEDGLLASSTQALPSTENVALLLEAHQDAETYVLDIIAFSPEQPTDSIRLSVPNVNADRLVGNLALVSHSPSENGARFWFASWQMDGGKLEAFNSRMLGPVIGSQHTLSRGTLKLTAQFLPLGESDGRLTQLQVADGSEWAAIATSEVVDPSFTATFRITEWDATTDTRFRVAYARNVGGATVQHYHYGTIKKDPVDKAEIVVAAFTGNHNVARGVDRGQFPWDWGVWFPHSDIMEHVGAHQPDFLFFSGDQVYEGASPTAADFEQPYEDYLYKWYLWYWAFGELTSEIPSVAIPDDHDVFHGNVWGAGGRATPEGLTGAAAQDAGGYKLPPEWVNMVERTQTSHLPDPYDGTPVEQGIGVYYTDILYGGVSFAVVEDRKFKSAPAGLLPAADVWNGWPRNRTYDPKRRADVAGATLLGERQLDFLNHWATDWSGGSWMKVLLSQTLFANVATLPDTALNGSVIPSLAILPQGEYAESERTVSDMDSNGWPQTGRNRALRAIRKGFAVHLAGDQHLGSTIQYGVDEWGDAGYALCVPSVANFWPRRWFPPVPGENRDPNAPLYTGDFEDGFGNKITVHAVSNPHKYGKEPETLHDLAPGYGIAKFNKETRTVSLAAWPRWADPVAGDVPYAGWPVTFQQQDNYGRTPTGYLPRLEVSGRENPVVQVVDETSGEVVYTLRINGTSFVPMVFSAGSYTVNVGEPDTGTWKTYEGLVPTPEVSGETVAVVLP